MHDWLVAASETAVLIVNALALVVIVFATIEAFVAGARVLVTSGDNRMQGDLWLRYARWLVAGLTFQLAADIIETSIAPSWHEIGRLAAIAGIRTFLNFFLERDMHEVRARQQEVRRGVA